VAAAAATVVTLAAPGALLAAGGGFCSPQPSPNATHAIHRTSLGPALRTRGA
jgi:hypothetical protein